MDNPELEPLVSCLTAPLPDAKELLEMFREAEIPATMVRDACCGKGGCGCAPKMQLLVAPSDVARVADLLRDRWQEMADQEDLPEGAAATATAEGADEACPACGTAAPLKEGACSDCGLQLE